MKPPDDRAHAADLPSVILSRRTPHYDELNDLIPTTDRYGGSTAAEPGYTFESAAEDILALARSLGHEQFILTGHSIGGFWCQQLAAKLPDHVRGIILWCPVADFGSPKMTQAHVKAAGRPPAVLHPTRYVRVHSEELFYVVQQEGCCV